MSSDEQLVTAGPHLMLAPTATVIAVRDIPTMRMSLKENFLRRNRPG
jgi:hypothetical protein